MGVLNSVIAISPLHSSRLLSGGVVGCMRSRKASVAWFGLQDTYCNSAKIGSTWETVGIQVAVDKSNSILWFPRTIVVCLIFLMPYHRNIPSDCCFWVRGRKERVCLPTKWICPRCVVNFSGMECLAETGILFGGRVLFGGWWVVDVIRLDLSLRWSAKNQHILHRAPAATQLVPGQRAPK